MGNIQKILSKVILSNNPLFANSLRIESSEAIHIHWRDTRILLDVDQFKKLLHSFNLAKEDWNGLLSQNDTVLDCSIIPNDIIFGDEAKIELLEGGNIHIHYRDIRFEVTIDVFCKLADMFCEARKNL